MSRSHGARIAQGALVGALVGCMLAYALWGAAGPALAAKGTSSIAGLVTRAATHEPVANVEVLAFSLKGFNEEEALNSGEGSFGMAHTNAAGEYKITGLNAEGFEVVFQPPEEGPLDLVPWSYGATSELGEGTPVTPPPGAEAAGIDFELQDGGAISGKVTDKATGAPVKGGTVCAVGPPGVHPPTAGNCSVTGTGGEYTMRGLPAGEYKVFFLASGYEGQYYEGAATGAAAKPVSVTVGSTLPGIDAALEAGEGEPGAGGPGGLGKLGSGLPGGLQGAGGGSPGSKGSQLKLRSAWIDVTRDGVALVKVRCSGGSGGGGCDERLTFTIRRRVRVGKRTVERTFSGPTVELKLKAGASATERIHLAPALLRRLRARRGKLAAELTLHSPAAHDESSASVQTVTLVRR